MIRVRMRRNEEINNHNSFYQSSLKVVPEYSWDCRVRSHPCPAPQNKDAEISLPDTPVDETGPSFKKSAH